MALQRPDGLLRRKWCHAAHRRPTRFVGDTPMLLMMTDTNLPGSVPSPCACSSRAHRAERRGVHPADRPALTPLVPTDLGTPCVREIAPFFTTRNANC